MRLVVRGWSGPARSGGLGGHRRRARSVDAAEGHRPIARHGTRRRWDLRGQRWRDRRRRLRPLRRSGCWRPHRGGAGLRLGRALSAQERRAVPPCPRGGRDPAGRAPFRGASTGRPLPAAEPPDRRAVRRRGGGRGRPGLRQPLHRQSGRLQGCRSGAGRPRCPLGSRSRRLQRPHPRRRHPRPRPRRRPRSPRHHPEHHHPPPRCPSSARWRWWPHRRGPRWR